MLAAFSQAARALRIAFPRRASAPRNLANQATAAVKRFTNATGERCKPDEICPVGVNGLFAKARIVLKPPRSCTYSAGGDRTGWAGMLAYYRGHIIIVLEDAVLTAEITERASGEPLPTKVAALAGEGQAEVIRRAKGLVDIYLRGR